MVFERHLPQELVLSPLYLRKRRILGAGGVESAMWSWSVTCRKKRLGGPGVPSGVPGGEASGVAMSTEKEGRNELRLLLTHRT